MDEHISKWVEDCHRLTDWVRAEQARDPERLPDIRTAARELRMSHKRVHDLARDLEAEGMIVNVAMGTAGGYYEFELIGDYLLEVA